jgi:outer membrane protein TolC
MFNKLKLLYLVLLLSLAIPIGTYSQELSLSELISKALQNNQNVKSSILDVSIADERIKEVKSNMLPQININGDYKYISQLPTQLVSSSNFGGPEDVYQPFSFGTPWNFGTTISVGQLIFSQQYFTGLKLAQTGKEMSELMIRKSKEDIAYNVSQAFYNAQIITAQMSFIRSNISSLDRLIQTSELLYENLLIKSSDVDKLKLNKTMLETQEKSLQASYVEIINVLKFLAGIPQSDELLIKKDISYKADVLSPDKIIPDRVELKLLEKQKEFNQLEQKKIIAGYFPTLSAYGIYNYTYFAKGGSADLFRGFPASWFGLQVNWSIFDGLDKKSKLEQKKLESIKIDLQKQQLQENIEMKLTNARNQITVHEMNVQNSKEQLALAEKIFSQSQLQFKEGIINITEVIQSENSLREAQNNYIVSLVKLYNAELDWKKASGKLLNNK